MPHITVRHHHRSLSDRGPLLALLIGLLAVSACDSVPTDDGVDTTPPATTLTAAPPAVTGETTATFRFESNEADSTFRCRLDDGDEESCSSPWTLSDLAEGRHEVRIAAVDAAGNTDASPERFSWTIQITPPDTLITQGPADPSPLAEASFYFRATVADATFRCALDDGEEESCSSPWALDDLAEGEHSVSITATDSAGHVDPSPARYTWTVVLTPPETVLSYGPPSPSPSATATFWFHSDDPTATFACRLDSGDEVACAAPMSYAALDEGEHLFAVVATNAAGRVDETPAIHSWTVDTLAPRTLLLAAPAAFSNLQTPSFEFDCSEDDCSFACRVDDGPLARCSSPWAPAEALDDGEHTFHVAATDAAGHTNPFPAEHRWVVDTDPPSTTFDDAPDPLSFAHADSLAFSTDEPASTSCTFDGEAFDPCTGEALFEALADGTHTFEVVATDRAGNVEAPAASVSWKVLTLWQEVHSIAEIGIGGNPYVAGLGSRLFIGSGRSDFLLSYDVDTDTVHDETLFGDLCNCGYSSQLAAAGGYLWYFANSAGRYDVESQSWSSPPYPDRTGESGVGVLDDVIYYIGGRGDRATVNAFDAIDQAWLPSDAVPDYPWSIVAPGVIGYDGKLWAMGGRTSTNHYDKMAVYDPAQGSWQELPNLPFEHRYTWSSPTAFELDGRFVVQGYEIIEVEGQEDEWLERYFLYHPDDGSWDDLELPLPDFGRYWSPIVLGDEVYLVGEDDRGDDTAIAILRFVPPWDD